jgi:hypothetical protein
MYIYVLLHITILFLINKNKNTLVSYALNIHGNGVILLVLLYRSYCARHSLQYVPSLIAISLKKCVGEVIKTSLVGLIVVVMLINDVVLGGLKDVLIGEMLQTIGI